MKPVVIVGGGLAGLAAGVSLSRSRIPVLLLEQRLYPGGRAASFIDRASRQTIDYGQHVMIAAYRRTLALLDTLETRNLVKVQPSPFLPFHHPDRGLCAFSLPGRSGEFGLLAGILSTDLFSMADKLRILRAGVALRIFRPDHPGAVEHMTIREWLDHHGQTPETVRSFWEPLAIAIMNEHISSASALVFLRSLQIAFQDEKGGSSMVIARKGLSDVFALPAMEYIRRNGGEVLTGVDVVGTSVREGDVTQLRARDGKSYECSAAILAVPSYRAAGLVPEELRRTGFLAGIGAMEQSPIISLHLWFEHSFMTQDFLGIIDGTAQWIFNRGGIEGSAARGGHVSMVISAAGHLLDASQDELGALALADLHRAFGRGIGRPVRSIVVREKRATFSCTPAAERIRPSTATPIRNFFLAGDWTATGLPATIEGAVISGEKAAAAAAAVDHRAISKPGSLH